MADKRNWIGTAAYDSGGWLVKSGADAEEYDIWRIAIQGSPDNQYAWDWLAWKQLPWWKRIFS